MSIQQDKFTNIANAIREVGGTSSQIVANNFATEILNLKSKILSLPYADVYRKSGSNYTVLPHDDASMQHFIQGYTDCYVLVFIPKSFVTPGGVVSSWVTANISGGNKITLGTKTSTTLAYVSNGSMYNSEYHNTVYCFPISNNTPEDGGTYANWINTNVSVYGVGRVEMSNVSFTLNVLTFRPGQAPD